MQNPCRRQAIIKRRSNAALINARPGNGFSGLVTWYETPCAEYEMPCAGYENEMSMKFAVHRQGMKKLCTVRKQIQWNEKNSTV
jgi:hypothetical protein